MTELEKAIADNSQTRTFFQLKHFVLGQHPTPEMKYHQLLLEAKALMSAIKIGELQLKKLRIQIEILKKSPSPIDQIDAEIAEVQYESEATHLIGIKKELDWLKEAFESGEKYTPEEIEANQKVYWTERLLGQATNQLRASGVINASHVDAMQQAEILNQFFERMDSDESLRPLEA